MALYDQLPVFKTSYELLLKIYDIDRLLPKEHKHILWEKLKTLWLELVVTIYQANSSTDKKPILTTLITQIETIKIIIRVSRDIGAISILQYADISLLIDSITKQLRWWQRSVKLIHD